MSKPVFNSSYMEDTQQPEDTNEFRATVKPLRRSKRSSFFTKLLTSSRRASSNSSVSTNSSARSDRRSSTASINRKKPSIGTIPAAMVVMPDYNSTHIHHNKRPSMQMSVKSSNKSSRTTSIPQSIPMAASNSISMASYGINLEENNLDEITASVIKKNEPYQPNTNSKSNPTSPGVSNSTVLPDIPPNSHNWKAPESWKVRNEPIALSNSQGTATTGTTTTSSISSDSPYLAFTSTQNSDDVSASSGDISRPQSPISPTSNRHPLVESFSTSKKGFNKANAGSVSLKLKSSHNKELRGNSKSSVRIFKGEMSSLLPCTLDTTGRDILDALRRKRFVKAEDDYILVLNCGGLARTLSLDEKPLKIQRTLLLFYGYTERDNLDFIERTDLSFLFKFIVEEKGVELISEEKKILINPQNVNLVNWNLQDIPNFLYAEPIVKLDVSENPSFEFTKEFMHDCRNLTSLSFKKAGATKFPTPVIFAPRLATLDLEVNYLKSIPQEISVMKNLSMLNLACNRINKLPDAFSKLANLQELNLSSNRFKEIPLAICRLLNLKRLDLSYNNITSFPDEFSKLKNIEVLQIAGNKLTGELPVWFSEFDNLIKVDLRFNQLDSIDSLKSSRKLEIIRAAGNVLSVFRSNATNLFEVELNMNPLTYVYFEVDMPNLKVIDFSKGKLSSCSFTSKLINVEKLILDQNHLSVLPEDINKMKNIVHLSVIKNNLNSLPNAIGDLKKLKYLDLHLNNISKLNENIWKLGNLVLLNVASNILENFPEPPDTMMHIVPPFDFTIGNSDSSAIDDENSEEDKDQVTDLKPVKGGSQLQRRRSSEAGPVLNKGAFGLQNSLKLLCLSDNKLTDSCFPTIGHLKSLTCLNLSYNEIFEIPQGHLSNLTNLFNLYLSGNYLSSLPTEDFESWSNLANFMLNGNRFTALPGELSRIKRLSALDVGSNSLKYNIANIPYDWNWCYNDQLKYLNFSGNKRLEIKPQHIKSENGEPLDSFFGLKRLRMLGLMDVTITTEAVPDQSVGLRVRSTVSQLGKFGYGISDTLGDADALTSRDVVIEKFRGNPDEFLIALYDGKNSVTQGGDKISKIVQETFEIHFEGELKSVGQVVNGSPQPKTIEDCMKGAFLAMNSEMNILINKDESSTFSSAAAHRTKTTDKLTMEEDGYSGCCATIVYIKGDSLYVANVGDIMGIMTSSNGEYKLITTKHEPYAPQEYERIRDSGGHVTTDGYLDGVSNVSRAVGFFKLIPHINSKPSVHKYEMTQNDEMIAICTSDIWKVVPYDLAADIVRQEKSNPGIAAEKLRDFAIAYGARGQKATSVVLSLRQFSTKQKHHNASQAEDSTLRKLDEEIEPPRGSLAMVFTDIKNSTVLWDNHPLAMRSAIKVHNAIMRRQLRLIGGYEVKTEGDAFVVSFPTPTSALLWCFVVQTQLLTTDEWPAEILSSDQGCEIKDNEGNIIFRGLSVRMGVHWGAPVCEPDVVTKRMDYFGPMVNRASRVSSVADGGQITMSNDFYNEIENVKKMHELIKDGKVDINRSYPYKGKGKDIDNQVDQLLNIGIVDKSIGAKKLKGLETPESIWLAFPKSLGSRLKAFDKVSKKTNNIKSNQLIYSGVTTDTAWSLRRVSLRLDKICSYLTDEQLWPPQLEQNTMSTSLQNEFTSMDSFLMLLIENCITRIENSVMMLSMRQTMAPDENSTLMHGSTSDLYEMVVAMREELRQLKGQ